ncbi:MAG: GOLPH3/VPS74 family protein [Nocardioidaceae bacterium]
MLLAEDRLLLLTHEVTGRLLLPAAQVDAGLGGANLGELALTGRIGLDERRRVVVLDPSPTGEPVLDAALGIASTRQGKKPKSLIQPLAKGLRPALYARLTDRGVLRLQETRVLGLFPLRRWPAVRTDQETAVRAQVAQVLVQGTTPDQRTAALVALLHALKVEHKVVDPRQYGVGKRDLRARADQIARGDWAADAVRQAVDDMLAAVTAASMAAAAAGSSGAS